MTDPVMRIGHGFDVHRFAEQAEADAQVMLGGVAIPHSHRLLAHSDGDVLLHAFCDALLGALALGDIGSHFSDQDPRYRGISSLTLLAEVLRLVKEQGWMLGNADLTLVAQAPRLSTWREAIRESIARACDCPQDRISVKATTTEGLGYTGRREGIACHAVVLLVRCG